MDDTPLAGRVIVVAGAVETVGPIAAALQRAGATVALVAKATAARDDVTVHMRADPCDANAWERVAMHVEQHLGPVDAAVADASAATATREALGADLRRRGRADVVVTTNDSDDPAEIVRRVSGRP